MHLILANSAPVKPLLSRSGAEGSCRWLSRDLTQVERLPFCQ
jgi:hypothetical protein